MAETEQEGDPFEAPEDKNPWEEEVVDAAVAYVFVWDQRQVSFHPEVKDALTRLRNAVRSYHNHKGGNLL